MGPLLHTPHPGPAGEQQHRQQPGHQCRQTLLRHHHPRCDPPSLPADMEALWPSPVLLLLPPGGRQAATHKRGGTSKQNKKPCVLLMVLLLLAWQEEEEGRRTPPTRRSSSTRPFRCCASSSKITCAARHDSPGPSPPACALLKLTCCPPSCRVVVRVGTQPLLGCLPQAWQPPPSEPAWSWLQGGEGSSGGGLTVPWVLLGVLGGLHKTCTAYLQHTDAPTAAAGSDDKGATAQLQVGRQAERGARPAIHRRWPFLLTEDLCRLLAGVCACGVVLVTGVASSGQRRAPGGAPARAHLPAARLHAATAGPPAAAAGHRHRHC